MRPIMAKAISYMKPDIDPNTSLYVPFNEGVGSIAKDYSQYGNHAQLTDVEWSNEGFNGAGKFNGSSSFGDCGNDASLNFTDAITIKASVKWETLATRQVIAAKFDYNAPICVQFLFWTDNINSDELRAYINTDAIKGSTTDANLIIDKWYHLVMSYNGSGTGNSGRLKIYIDDVSKSLTIIGTIPSSLSSCPSIPLQIGYNTDNPYSPNYFNGTINEVRIYNQVLNAAQIAADCYEVVCG